MVLQEAEERCVQSSILQDQGKPEEDYSARQRRSSGEHGGGDARVHLCVHINKHAAMCVQRSHVRVHS